MYVLYTYNNLNNILKATFLFNTIYVVSILITCIYFDITLYTGVLNDGIDKLKWKFCFKEGEYVI